MGRAPRDDDAVGAFTGCVFPHSPHDIDRRARIRAHRRLDAAELPSEPSHHSSFFKFNNLSIIVGSGGGNRSLASYSLDNIFSRTSSLTAVVAPFLL